MKKTVVLNSTKLATLASATKDYHATRQAIENAQKQARNLRSEISRAKHEAIREMRDIFLEAMEDRNKFSEYIRGAYSHEFTKFVDRKGVRLSVEHAEAMHEYSYALTKLNRVFVQELKKDPEAIFNHWCNPGLKNLDKVG